MIRRDVFFGVLLVALGAARAAQAHDQYLIELQEKARGLRLHESQQWRMLLHYRPMWYGGWRSEADGLGFFNAGRAGKTDPRRELAATLAALRRPPVAFDPQRPEQSQHPQCRFPARWTFLKNALAIDAQRFPDVPCPLYETWRQAIAAERVTLVYAAAYLNSPASMYGHTFLRLSRSTAEGNPLLDYIINFGAEIDTDNGIVYALKGTTGGFRGRFYVMPYYVKIQEYSHIESRDLWEYELALGPEQVARLVAHAWETRTTHFDYFFFSENCSYFLLGLLEAAEPSLALSERFGAWVIPADTVRAALAIPGLVRGEVARPSLRATMTARKRVLDGREVRAAEALARSGRQTADAIAALPPERQALVVDAATDRLRYREGLKANPSAEFARLERELLILRGRTGQPPQTVAVEPITDAPERGHRTFRLGLGGGLSNRTGGGNGFEELSLRVAIHDQLDPPRGYPPDASLEMGSLRLRFDNDERRVSIDRLDLVSIVSPAPLDRWVPQFSWKARIGSEQVRALGCNGWGCLAALAGAGGGVAVRVGRPLLVYGFFDSEIGAGPPFHDGYRVGLGGSAAALLRVRELWQVQLQARYLYYFLGDDRRPLALSAGSGLNLGRRAQLRVVAEAAGDYREARVEALAYF